MTDQLDRAIVEHLAHRDLVAHEAAHAAAGLALGLKVLEVSAPYWHMRDMEHADATDSAGYVLIAQPANPSRDHIRKMALTTLLAGLEEGTPGWPPRWPLSLAPATPDEKDLGEAVSASLGDNNREGYRQLINDAHRLHTSPKFELLHTLISKALERNNGHVDQPELDLIAQDVTSVTDPPTHGPDGVILDWVVDQDIARMNAPAPDHVAPARDGNGAHLEDEMKRVVLRAIAATEEKAMPLQFKVFEC